MDQSDHVLISAFSLGYYNDKVGCKSAQIQDKEDDFCYHEVSSVLLLSHRHYFN